MYFYMNITCILESICLDDKNYAVQHESSIFFSVSLEETKYK